MQWLTQVCVHRPVFALMLILAMIVAGTASYAQLGVDRFPKMDLPTVIVSTLYPGASAQEVESEVSRILEDSVATVAGIDELRSISRESNSLLILTFNLDRDIDAGAQDVRDAINAVLNRLPENVDPPVIRKQDTDASPIITLAVSGPRDSRELFFLADRYVKNVIESAPGVGEAKVAGSAERAIRVNVEAKRLAAYGVSIMEVRDALARQNVEIPAGRVDTGVRELELRTLGRVDQTRDFEELVVATVDGVPIRLRDLGTVVDDTKEVRNLARLNGVPAVVVQVQRQSGANTLEVIDGIKARLPRSQALLPPDVQVTVLQDQSRYIEAAMHEVQGHLISGSILATLVVLAFMRSWRSTVIAGVAIPASIIATFAVMRALDFTLNNVTLLALVLMVGVVIDDAIVVLENVFHCMEEKGMPPMEAAIEGTREIGLAVLATTLSLVIVFLPVAFLSSVTGRMLYQFGITAAAAIMVSLIVSFSLTPMMCSRMLRVRGKASGSDDNAGGHCQRNGDNNGAADLGPASRRGFYQWIERGYLASLGWAMRHRWLVLLVALATVASNVPLYHLVRQDYIPTNVDESEFEVSVTAPEGVTIRSMASTMELIESEVGAVGGVEVMLTTVGARSGTAVNNAQIYVRLTPIDERRFSLGRLWRETLAGQPQAAWDGNFTQQEKMLDIRRRLKKYPDLDIGVRNQTSLRQGAPVDIDFSISGPDLRQLSEYAQELEQTMKQIPGVVDTYVTLKFDKPELLVHIDRDKAGMLGVDVQEIADTLRIAVGGDDRVSRYRDDKLDDAYDVELRLVGVDRDSASSIAQLYVRTKPSERANVRGLFPDLAAATDSGVGVTRLDNVVHFTPKLNAARVDRLDRQRSVAVRANVESGYALGDRLQAVQQAALEMGMPSAYSTSVRGRGRELERSLQDFAYTFLLSFIFMYIVLAAQFEHLVHPLTILASLPVAVPFGLFSLWLGGETLNLYSALGILVLFGVVKKNSILQVDHTNQLRARGLDRTTAILHANRDRLRPILMTTISFVFGMLPLLIAVGPGAEERRSIAVLAVGGQTLSLLLTLLAVPVIYSFFDDVSVLLSGGRSKATVDGAPTAARMEADRADALRTEVAVAREAIVGKQET
jgi:hydrophobic/amphiphilic exporter-1 (mainly G- bacteria), HAE1 family